MKDILNFINGEFVKNLSGNTFEDRNPVDNSLIGKVFEAGQPEVDAAVSAASAALKGPWGKLAVTERVKLLDEVAQECCCQRRIEPSAEVELSRARRPKALPPQPLRPIDLAHRLVGRWLNPTPAPTALLTGPRR